MCNLPLLDATKVVSLDLTATYSSVQHIEDKNYPYPRVVFWVVFGVVFVMIFVIGLTTRNTCQKGIGILYGVDKSDFIYPICVVSVWVFIHSFLPKYHYYSHPIIGLVGDLVADVLAVW